MLRVLERHQAEREAKGTRKAKGTRTKRVHIHYSSAEPRARQQGPPGGEGLSR
jgi:hypothetical protein